MAPVKARYVSVIFPLALPRLYTYEVPEHLAAQIQPGVRVEVALKNRLYSAIVARIHERNESESKPRPVISVIDPLPVVTEAQLRFWNWLAEYYCCTLGEVMHIALPAGMKLASETRIVLKSDYEANMEELSDDEYMIAEALSIQNELSIEKIQDILNKKTIYPVIRKLLDKGIIYVKEEMVQKFKPKLVRHIALAEPFRNEASALQDVVRMVEKSEKQTRVLLAYIQATKNTGKEHVPVSEITRLAEVDSATVTSLVKKGIFDSIELEVSRVLKYANAENDPLPPLSEMQQTALKQIQNYFTDKKPVLIHGITGSGKTRIYTELIKTCIEYGKQALYLLPEIALTTQTVQRLKVVFGSDVMVYHSRMSDNERVEVWKAVLQGQKIILSARSGLLLPYKNLGLIIVDEEHDPSYKQNDPNPRYNARDAALFLARQMKIDIILGSATPSLESYQNAVQEKFGLVELPERYGASVLPDIHIVDLKKELKDQRFDGLFSMELREAIQKALVANEQVILFQNRRGYSPTLTCELCGWKAGCINCDVNLTVHRFTHELRCHYCGSRSRYPHQCPECGNRQLTEVGFGTEKIEEAIAGVFPQARVDRLDLDTAKTKLAYEKILYEFGEGNIDILVGTQMITKGLDFDHISVVGVLNADSLMRYPDIRANERAFQLLTQVAGRAGRREKPGKVYIQTYNPQHPVIMETLAHHYRRFFQREMAERQKFRYPPFYRMLQIEFMHKQPDTVEYAANTYADILRPALRDRLLGPATPPVNRIRGQYIQIITVKMERDPKIVSYIKNMILEARYKLKETEKCKSVRVVIDVDPY